MKLIGYLKIKSVLTCTTGLLIGGTDTFGIGGIDKKMIRASFSGNKPYIPGSSIKGKMRNLLEQSLNLINGKEVHSCKNGDKDCPVCRIFGAGKTEDLKTIPRLIVRDASLIDSEEIYSSFKEKEYITRIEDYLDRYGSFVEIKTENTIDRTSGTAFNPRTFERVPAGFKFYIELVYKVGDYEPPNEKNDQKNYKDDIQIFNNVIESLKLVEQDYIGASGSRGYGRVGFSEMMLSYLETSTGKEYNLLSNFKLETWEKIELKSFNKMVAKAKKDGAKT